MNIESFVGPITLVVAFGLLIARLTRPRMRLGFSESAIIAPYEGGRALMFRIVNLRPGELSDVQVRVNLAWYEEIGGVRERNFHELALERNSVELFTLHWTVVHPITADSPLAGVTPENLAAAQAEFLMFVNALEETFSTRVSTRASYMWDEVRWDVKFASIFANGPDGVIAIDVERLSRTERLDDGATRTPAAIEGRATAAPATLARGAARLSVRRPRRRALPRDRAPARDARSTSSEIAPSLRRRMSIRRSARDHRESQPAPAGVACRPPAPSSARARARRRAAPRRRADRPTSSCERSSSASAPRRVASRRANRSSRGALARARSAARESSGASDRPCTTSVSTITHIATRMNSVR